MIKSKDRGNSLEEMKAESSQLLKDLEDLPIPRNENDSDEELVRKIKIKETLPKFIGDLTIAEYAEIEIIKSVTPIVSVAFQKFIDNYNWVFESGDSEYKLNTYALDFIKNCTFDISNTLLSELNERNKNKSK